MSAWVERVLEGFLAELKRFWVVADPDDVLLDEQILAGLRARGFEVLPYDDSIAFRWDFEDRYRSAWDTGRHAPAQALILHLRGTTVDSLPWDYLRQGRRVSLGLADLFPNLSYGVVRQIGYQHLETLFDAQTRHAVQRLGDVATKDFILLHVFRLSPHLVTRPEDLWRELLRLHFDGDSLPPILADHVGTILASRFAFPAAEIAELFESKPQMLRVVQGAWAHFLGHPDEPQSKSTIPFGHPDIRGYLENLFREGQLHPLTPSNEATNPLTWAAFGFLQPSDNSTADLAESVQNLLNVIPGIDASHRDWLQMSARLGEILYRFNTLTQSAVTAVEAPVRALQVAVDDRLRQWVERHYEDLPSLPPAKAPAMLHHVPRYLSMRREAGEAKIALLLFDGLAMDQWIQIRHHLARNAPDIGFQEGACFAWLPSLTSVSRQALFSGMKPREFADSIGTTSREPLLWSRFWQDHGLKSNEVVYRKALRRNEHLAEIDAAISAPATKVVGLVVDTVDEIIHGAVLGKRGVANQIESWCETGFILSLFRLLHAKGFHVYLTADHGNVEASGIGRLNQGDISELKGERVRVYRSQTLASAVPDGLDAFRMDIAGLPADFLPLFAGGRGAFIGRNEPVVAHGGLSAEELIVPFVKVTDLSRSP